MTESNGIRGAQAEAWANRQPLGIPEPQGPFYPQPQQTPQAPQPQPPKGFVAGDFWQGTYDFTACGVNATGTIPMPSQAKIDAYERTMMLLDEETERLARATIKPFEELQVRAEDAGYAWRKARAERDEETAAKWRAELDRIEEEARLTSERVDEAFGQKAEILAARKDAAAAVCSNKPTRNQLEKVNEPILLAFINYIGELLSPNS